MYEVDEGNVAYQSDAQLAATLELYIDENNGMEEWATLLRSPLGAPILRRVKERRELIRSLYGRIDAREAGAVQLLANFQGREEEIAAIFAGVDAHSVERRQKELAKVIEICRMEVENRNRQRDSRQERGNGILPEELNADTRGVAGTT